MSEQSEWRHRNTEMKKASADLRAKIERQASAHGMTRVKYLGYLEDLAVREGVSKVRMSHD